jgi:replicative DNA helicase
MMIEPEVVKAALGAGLESDDFFRPGNRVAFDAMRNIYQRGDVVEPATLAFELQALGKLGEVGGLAFIGSVTDAVPSASNHESYIRTVQELSALRGIMGAARKVLGDVAESKGVPAEEVHSEAVRVISSVRAPMFGTAMQPIREILLSVYEDLYTLGDPEQPVEFRTGLPDVDRMIGGAKDGDLIILAARPSMGKSSFALSNITAEMAITHRKHVAVFSPETKRGPMTKRLLQSESRINFNAARERGGLDPLDYPRLEHATGLLQNAPISFDDTSGLTLAQMRSKLRRLCATSPYGKPKVIVVDYLQKMRHPMSKENKTGETAAIVEGLKDIAMEFGAIVVALSQLSREVEKRPDKRPQMSDLRYAGEIEQEADIIIFLYRPEQYHGSTDKDGNSLVGKAEAIIAKSRDGRTGNILIAFEAEFTKFANWNHR